MEEWKEYRLGDIISISSGLAYKGEHLGKGDSFLLGMGCVSYTEQFLEKGMRKYDGAYDERYSLKAGDIVLATRQQSDNLPILGMPAIIPQKFHNQKMVFGTNLYKVNLNSPDFSNSFLYWLLKTPNYIHHIKSCQTGTTVRMITKANIEDYTFFCPEKSEREKICKFLWNIENKIALNRRINDNLEQQAQALFKSWFVDFEPFKDGKFVDSEMGMIPEGWKVGKLEDIADVVGGGTPSKANALYFDKQCIPWITPKDLSIKKTKFISKGEIDITEEGYKNSSAKKIPLGSVLFSSRAPIGYISIAENELTTNQGFKSVVPVKAGTSFLYLYLKANTKAIEAQATGSTFKEASGSLMKSLCVIIPPDTVFDSFERNAFPFFSAQANVEREIVNLSKARDTLLPRLMSGELKINDLNC